MSKRAKNTLSPDFSVNAGSVKGKIKIAAVEGSVNKVLTLTNAALTDNRTATFQDATGIVALTSDVAAVASTTSNTFTVDADSVTGKIIVDVALGSANKSLTITNTALTDDRVVTFPNATGTVMLVPAAQTELTDELATITCDAPGSADYAIATAVQNTGFGFSTADEMHSVLKVIANLQTRVNELETKLVALGFLVDAD